MNPYGPPSTSAAFPRGQAPAFRGPPAAFPRGIVPTFATLGPPPPFAFHGPPPAFHGPRPPLTLNLGPMMASPHYQAPVSPATCASMLPSGWQESRTPQGAVYYFNATTGMSTYDVPPSDPAPSAWVEYSDEATGASYYFNTVTKATVWDQPEEFRMQKAREQVAKMTSDAREAESPVSPLALPSNPIDLATPAKSHESDPEEAQQRDLQAQARHQCKEVQEHHQAAALMALPRTERLAAFKQFLAEKLGTSAMKWSDAQRLISKDASLHKDPRWTCALSTVGEKKQAYAEYCTHAKNRGMIEKRRLVKKAREELLELLGLFETSLAPSGRRPRTWDEVNASTEFYAMRHDRRWTAIDDTSAKQQVFTTFLHDVERNKQARLATHREVLKQRFLLLLQERIKAEDIQLDRHGSKRLDSDSKRRVLDILATIKAADDTQDEALREVDRHDVYDWTEAYVRGCRAMDQAKRKRERIERAGRTERVEREWSERLKELVKCGHVTAASTWDEWARKHVQEARESTGRHGDGHGETEDDENERHPVHDTTPRRVFDKVVRRLRRALEPTAAIIRTCLDRTEPGLRVTAATPFDVYMKALLAGGLRRVATKALEEGNKDALAVHESGPLDKVETLDVLDTQARPRETVGKIEQESTGGCCPAYVRQVFDMWVAMAKEERKRDDDKHAKRRKRRRKESHDDVDDDDPARRSRRRSSTGDEHDDQGHKKRRTRRGARKRRRSHASLSPSRSRSKDRRHARRTPSRSRDHAGALPPTALAGGYVQPLESETGKLPLHRLSAADEAAKAEEIIRQARLKLQAHGKHKLDDGELEEGEEVEEGKA